jgi:hypothetical protein
VPSHVINQGLSGSRVGGRHEGWDFGAGVSFGTSNAQHVDPFDPWFVEPLDGYGSWIYVSDFDGPIWFPRVERVWRPYVQGYWVTTNIGVMWVADEPWGWLTHHYGRWVYLDDYGWGWVPGYDYAPAWVAWVVADDCVGWAPLPPDGFHYRHHRPPSGMRGYYGCPVGNRIVDIDYNVFVFVSNRDFHNTRFHGREFSGGRSEHFFKSKNVQSMRRDPDAEFVSRITNERVRPVRVEGRSYRSGDRRIVDYRPAGETRSFRETRKDEGWSSGRTPVQVERKAERPVERRGEPRSERWTQERGRSYEKPVEPSRSKPKATVRKDVRTDRRENAAKISERKRAPERTPSGERAGKQSQKGTRKPADNGKNEHKKKR